ncbi:MAG: Ig-like domain-containing protein [Spirochaetes bacterium]|nr:Ig-like domain-containing protein [Spirochaetota bacterium]
MKKNINLVAILLFSLILVFLSGLHFFNTALTKSELKVIAVSPRGGTEGVRESEAITITFNEPVVALKKLDEEIKEGPIQLSYDTTGKYKWLGTRSLAFYPDKKFPVNTRITVTVKKGITSVQGNKLETDHVWSFETLRPSLSRSTPYNEQKWVRLDSYVYLYFNLPMKLNTSEYITITEDGQDVPYRTRYIQTNELYYWERQSFDKKTALVLMPTREFNKSSKITVYIKPGCPALEGHLGTKYKSLIYFYTYYDFKFTGEIYQKILPERCSWNYCDALSLPFTNPVEYRELFKNMTVNPQIKLPVDDYENSTWNTHDFCLTLGFEPEKSYEIKLARDLKDIFGQKLNNDITIKIDVGSYSPYFSMPTGMGIVESYEGRKFPVTLRNPENMVIRTKVVDKDDIIPHCLWRNYFYIPWKVEHLYKHAKQYGNKFKFDMDEAYEPKTLKNKYQLKALYLDKYLKKQKYGLINLELKGRQGCDNYEPEYRSFLQVTDMGLTAKFSAEGNLIFLTDLKTEKPVSGADIEIRDDYNKVLWKGKTDREGMAKTPGWLNFGLKQYTWEGVRQWVFAQKGKDVVFINSEWGTGIYPWRFGISYNMNPVYPDYQGAIRTERGLYRPGEKVHMKGVLREKIKGEWKISSLKDLDYIVKDSRGNKLKQGKVKLNSFGSFFIDLKIPENAPTGYYSVQVFQKKDEDKRSKIKPKEEQKIEPMKGYVNLYGSFRVEVFQPLQYEVRIWAQDKKYYLNEKATFNVTGWYLFGAPMSDKKVYYVVNANETSYRPPGNEGFNFTEMKWLDDEYYYYQSKRLRSETTVLDKKGELKIPVDLKWQGDVHSFDITLEATVYGEDQQQVSSRKSLMVHGSRFYIGLKREKYFVEKGKKAEFTIITVDPDGNRREDDEVKIKVYRRYWESVRKAEVGGRYSWQSQKVDKLVLEDEIETTKKGKTFSFKPEQTGMYYLRAESKDSKGCKVKADDYVYSVGEGYAPWLMSDDDRIELVADKMNYKPGDEAKVLIKSPYDQCTALVTVEREFVLKQWVKKIKGSAAVVKIPIEKDYLPNVFVGVSLVKGRVEDKSFTNWGTDLGKPSLKIGYVALNVSPEERRLKVDIEKSHKTREPGEPLEVNFKVKDKKGKGVEAECMVAVCDVGVLNLIGYQTPDFFSTFYGPRSLNVNTSDTRLHIIGQRNYGEKGENRGGGGAPSEKAMRKRDGDMEMDLFSFRKTFLSTAFYKADIVTDKNGQAKIKFNMPDNLTTFRIMVTPVTRQSYFGSGEDYVIVKKYLMLKTTLPLFAIVDDTFQAGAVVYNYTEEDAQIRMAIEVENAKIKGDKIKTVKVKKGESADVRFDFHCDQVGKVKVKIAARADKYSDAVEKTFEVKAPRLTESVALFESFDKNEDMQKIVIPDEKEVFPGAGYLQVYLSPTAFSGLKSGIDFLLEYPYGCLEQKLSKILPVILSKRLILDLNLTIYTEKELDRLVNDVFKEMPNYQAYNGGFCYWTSKYWDSPWLTAYACFALLKAKEEGYKVDQAMLNKALNYLSDYARYISRYKNLPYNYYCHLTSQSYIAYVLALGNKPNRTLINKLLDEVEKIPLFGKASLLKAMYLTKYSSKQMEKVTQILFNKVKLSSTTAHFEDENMEGLWWIHSSSIRATSIILQAFMETRIENTLNDKVVNWLVRSRKKGKYLNTQDNVFAFYAMTDYFKLYEKDKPDFKATFLVEGKSLLSQAFKTRTDPSVLKNFDFDKFERGKELKAVMQRQGQGRLYYGLRLKYAPKELLKSRDEGMKVEKWYETLDGKKVEDPVFESGKDYVVVLKVNTKQERHFVVLDDPIPAGFRIINLSFQTESQDKYKGLKTTDRWWGSFNHTENYEDKVLVFADSLYHGDHTYRFVVRAVTPGKYLLPPTKVEEMYDPDVFGYYGQQYVTVK